MVNFFWLYERVTLPARCTCFGTNNRDDCCDTGCSLLSGAISLVARRDRLECAIGNPRKRWWIAFSATSMLAGNLFRSNSIAAALSTSSQSLSFMAHRRSLHAQALRHRGICMGRTSKQAPGCRERGVQYRDRACCLLAFSNQYRDHTTCADLAGIWGPPRGTRESGERTLAVPKRAIG
jgi:hypothetical protein